MPAARARRRRAAIAAPSGRSSSRGRRDVGVVDGADRLVGGEGRIAGATTTWVSSVAISRLPIALRSPGRAGSRSCPQTPRRARRAGAAPPRRLAAKGEQADLGPVAMGHDQVALRAIPASAARRRRRCGAGSRRPSARRAAAGRCRRARRRRTSGVRLPAAGHERADDRLLGRQAIGRLIQTALAGPSITSAATSSPRWPPRRDVAANVIDGPASAVWDQAANGLPTEQAVVRALVTGRWEANS